MPAAKSLQTIPPLSRNALHVLLAIGAEERHGYAIMREVERLTDGLIRLGPGAIYTTIRRLSDDGLIEETEERPDSDLDDQRRRYYRLTPAGRKMLASQRTTWQTFFLALDRVARIRHA